MDLNIKEAFASQFISLSSLVEASATPGSEAPSVLSKHAQDIVRVILITFSLGSEG